VDTDGDGFEPVTLDASASHDTGGAVAGYSWSIGGRTVAGIQTPMLNLPEGEHHVRLAVTDDMGQVDSDAVRVRVRPVAPGENRLACPGFEETPCAWEIDPGAGVTTSAPHSGARGMQLVQDGGAHGFSQRVGVSPGVYTVSGWLRTRGLAGTPATLVYTLFAADGAVLASGVVAEQTGTAPYSYYQVTFDAPDTVAFLELAGTVEGVGAGVAFFDDLRVRDRNLLRNGGFELRSPDGGEDTAPGWVFARGGAVVSDPVNVRSGHHALALAPHVTNHAIRQAIVHVPSPVVAIACRRG